MISFHNGRSTRGGLELSVCSPLMSMHWFPSTSLYITDDDLRLVLRGLAASFRVMTSGSGVRGPTEQSPNLLAFTSRDPTSPFCFVGSYCPQTKSTLRTFCSPTGVSGGLQMCLDLCNMGTVIEDAYPSE